MTSAGQRRFNVVNPWNKNIGRRTGRDITAGKNIRIGEDGFENFDDYLSESDADVTEEFTRQQVSCIREESHFTSSQGSTTCTSAGSEDECRQNTSNCQGGVSQSVPNASACSNAYNSISTSQSALSQLNQGGPSNRSKFEWLRNKNIGRRTGKDITANKQIRVDEDGFENFDDYMSESDVSTVSSRMSISIRKPASQNRSLSKPASGDQSTRFSSQRNSIETTSTSSTSTETKSPAYTDKMSSEVSDQEEHLHTTVQDHNSEESTKKTNNKQNYTDSPNKSSTSEEEDSRPTPMSGHRSDYTDTPLSSRRSSSMSHVDGTVSFGENRLDVNTKDSSKISGLSNKSLLSSLRQNQSIRTDLPDRSRSQKASTSETSHLSKSKVDRSNATTVQDHNSEESTKKKNYKQNYTDSPNKSSTSEEEDSRPTPMSGHRSDYTDTPLSSRRISSASHVDGTVSFGENRLDVNTKDSSKISRFSNKSLSSSLRQNQSIRTDLPDRSRSQKASTSETSHLSKSKKDRSNAEEHSDEKSDGDEKSDSEQDLDQSSVVNSDSEHDSLSDRDEKSNIHDQSNIEKMVYEKQTTDNKQFIDMKSANENITGIKMTSKVSDGEEEQIFDEHLSDSGVDDAENTNHHENDEMAHSKQIDEMDNEEKEGYEMNENAEEDDSGELRPSQAPTQIDVAGNRSGSITKLEVPASVVSFNKTRKRLSYSAMELSEETRQSNRSRIITANEELRANNSKKVTKEKHSRHFTILDNKSSSTNLDNNNSQKPVSVARKNKTKSENTDSESLKQNNNVYNAEESDFLCLAGRSMHPAESQGNDKISDDEDDIMIFDDYPNRNKSLGAKQKLKNQNKKANDFKSDTGTVRDNDVEDNIKNNVSRFAKTEVKAKKPVRSKGRRKTTHGVNTRSNKVNKNSKKKIVDEVNEMINSENVNDNVIDTEVEVDLITEKGQDNSDFSTQENIELEKTNVDNDNKSNLTSGKSSAKAKTTSKFKGKSLGENNTSKLSKTGKGQNKRKEKKEQNGDTGLQINNEMEINNEMSEHSSSDDMYDQQKLTEKPHENIQNSSNDDHDGDIVTLSAKETFNKTMDDTTKSISIKRKNIKKELKRKSVSDDSEESNKENDSHSSRKVSKESKLKKAKNKDSKRNSKSCSPDTYRKSKSSLDAELKLTDMNGNATPEAGGRLSVPVAFGSGVSFRVSRRSELLQDVGSGYFGEVTVRKEPVEGLTPCLSRAGAKKRKGRRVTICSEMNTELEYTEKHSDDNDTESGSLIKQLRYSTESRGSTSSLPSADSTPMHIFETTHSDTPKAGNVDLSVIKDRLIKPSPPMEGLRRSKRTRLAPIAWYKNEQIVFDYRRKSGPVIIGVQPSLEVKWNKMQEENRKKRKLKSEIRKAARLNKTASTPRRKLSMHRSLPLDLEKIQEEPVHEITVYNQALDTEDCIDCIAKHEGLKALGPDHKSPKKEDPYLITPIFNHPCVSAGNLTIRGNAEKPEHLVTADYTLFRIEYGKVLVRIHKTSAVLDSGDTFLVPIGNSYSIMNLRSDDAKLFYTIHQQTEDSVSTPKNSEEDGPA